MAAARAESGIHRPVWLKVAPDLDGDAIGAIVEACLAHGIDALAVSNTTLARPASLRSAQKDGTGGLSGAPLMLPATRALAQAYQAARGRLPLVGIGGVASAEDAFAKIAAGASLVQLYTAMIYAGPGLPSRIVRGLDDLLERDGLTIAALTGRDAAAWAAS